MSTLGIGKDDISEQTQALKDAASSKECENADLRSQLFKRDCEFSELNATLNETLRKLSHEADRALRLESALSRMSDDLSHHKLTSQNAEQALEAANAKLRVSELNERELQSHLEVLSLREDAAKEGTSKILKEKKVLEARVKELDAEVRQLSASAAGIPKKMGRARSSSVSMGNFKNAAMEHDLNDVRASLAIKEKELCITNEKLNRAQTQLLQAQNEQMAMEKKMKIKVEGLEASLEEKDYELDDLRAQQASGGHEREEELMRRIEEDEAKILALEILVGESHKLQSIKDALKRTEKQLKEEIRKSEESEKQCVELAREREEVLDELEKAREVLYDKEAEIKVLACRKTELEADIIAIQTTTNNQSFAVDIDPGQSSGQPTHESQSPKDDAATHIATLLSAVDRLRGERDGLKRDLNFLESENRFAVQALEAKVAMTSSPTNGLKAVQAPQNRDQIRRLSLVATASAVVASHLQGQLEGAFTTIDNIEYLLAEATKACRNKDSASQEIQAQLGDALHKLATAVAERATLLTRLETQSQYSPDEIEKLKLDLNRTKETLKEVEAQLLDASKSVEDVKEERDSLHLQVTNLQTDLTLAQEEFTKAENRYCTLQAQQLSSMSSSDVAHSLREQIKELEMRVLRRTEQIGIHQHDIRRLETNLRLQEERVGEMTAELETLATQKDAMVEDCADAREARDEAIQRCEKLELDVEGLEMRLEQSEMGREQEAMSLIGLIVDSVVRSRAASMKPRNRSATDSVTGATSSEIRGAILALSVSQIELKQQATSLARSRGINHSMQTRVQSLEGELATTIANSKGMAQQLDDLRKLSTAGASAEVQAMANLQNEHSEQQHALQSRLDATVVELQQVQEKHAQLETRYQRTVEETIKTKEELTARVEALSRLEEAKESLVAGLVQTRDDHTAEMRRIQDQLMQAEEARGVAIQAHSELHDVHLNTVAELTRTKEDYEGRLSRATLDNIEATRKFEEALANGRVVHAEALCDLEDQLKHSAEEVHRLQVQLQEEVAGHDQDRQHLNAKIELCLQAESLEAELHNEIASTRSQLDQTRSVLQRLESEKSALQIESTDLAAELQRTLSMNRFLQNEVKAHEICTVTLQETVNTTKQELSRSEKSGKEAEINLSLQNVRHEQVVAGLRRELATLKANPRLDEVVTELKERNREMDELLKSKCAEIEANDDHVLQMLKDKNKLSNKVESLTRRVQALQAKLASAKESMLTTERNVSPPSSSVSISGTITPMPRERVVPPVPQVDARPRSNAMNRVVSVPTSNSRPKTPEHRPPPPAVFKARTPEKRAPTFTTPPNAVLDNIPVASGEVSIGKKRVRPEEFDDVNVPVQALYAESRHGQENSAPRLRRALQSVHTGFTPKRTINRASPGKNTMGKEGGLSDMTNSPHSMKSAAAKSSKRSWLGKIRGVSSQASSNGTPSHPGVFERVPGS